MKNKNEVKSVLQGILFQRRYFHLSSACSHDGLRGKNSSISSVTQQQELPPGSAAPEAPQGHRAGAPQPPAARAPSPAHSKQVQTSRPASSPPCSLRTLWLVPAGLWGARKQQLNIQVISLPAPAVLAVGCELAAAAFT